MRTLLRVVIIKPALGTEALAYYTRCSKKHPKIQSQLVLVGRKGNKGDYDSC